MKAALRLLLPPVASLGLVSCVTPVQGTGSVEALERQSPVTPVPSVREGEFARAAADYAGDYHRHHRYSRGGWSRY